MKNFKTNKMLFIALLIGFCSCKTKNEDFKNELFNKNGYFEYQGGTWSSVEYKIEEKIIDSCQYILIFGAQGRNLIHKANCRNTIHTLIN